MPVEGSTDIHNDLLEALRTELERERLRINECEALEGNLDLLNNMTLTARTQSQRVHLFSMKLRELQCSWVEISGMGLEAAGSGSSR